MINPANYGFSSRDEEKPTTRFTVLASQQLRPNLSLVISLRSDGKVAIAQRIDAEVQGKPYHMYLKNSLEVQPVQLLDVRALLDEAIKQLFDTEGQDQTSV